MEGTDETVRRGGGIARGKAVLVKFSRPSQDPRFDIPAAGPETVRVCAESGVSAVSLEARKTLLLEKQRMIELAEENGIAVHGFCVEVGGWGLEARTAKLQLATRNPNPEPRTPK